MSVVGGLLLCLVALWAAPAHAAPFVYVANRGDNTVSVLDTATNTVSVVNTSTNTVVATVPVDNSPGAVAVAGFAYVANQDDGTLSKVDLIFNTVVATVPVAVAPPQVQTVYQHLRRVGHHRAARASLAGTTTRDCAVVLRDHG